MFSIGLFFVYVPFGFAMSLYKTLKIRKRTDEYLPVAQPKYETEKKYLIIIGLAFLTLPLLLSIGAMELVVWIYPYFLITGMLILLVGYFFVPDFIRYDISFGYWIDSRREFIGADEIESVNVDSKTGQLALKIGGNSYNFQMLKKEFSVTRFWERGHENVKVVID